MFTQKFIREIKSGVKNLTLHGMRSVLTMLGMIFGVSSVVAMLAVGEGAGKKALEQIQLLGSNNIIINSIKPTDETGKAVQRTYMGIYGLLYEDEIRLSGNFSTINRTVPAKIIRKQARFGTRALELRVVGTTPAWFNLVKRPIIAGRSLLPKDLREKTNVAVLTEHAARRLLAGEDIIGQSVRIGASYFVVVGIVRSQASQGGTIQTPDQEMDAYVPISTAREHFGDIMVRRTAGSRLAEMVELHQIIVQVDEIENVESTAKGIFAMLARFHKKNDYHIQVPLTLLHQAKATKRTFNIVLGSIAAISLLVGGIGIMNIMLASVTERTREIGIRRAIGAKGRQIIHQFLIETVVLSTTGGLAGIAVGLFLPWLITRITGLPTVVTGSSLVLSLGISMSVGIVFGLYPAMRAARLDPITALRHE